jgi:hypothetical protein
LALIDVRRTTRFLSQQLHIAFCCWEEHHLRFSTKLFYYRMHITTSRWTAPLCQPRATWSLPQPGLLSTADQHRGANFTDTQSLHSSFCILASTIGSRWCGTRTTGH